MYFRLRSSVYLIGQRNSIIYSEDSNKLYFLDAATSAILTSCEKNIRIQDICFDIHKVKKILNYLKEHKLGDYHNVPVFIDKTITHSPYSSFFPSTSFSLKTVFIDYPGYCDFNCGWCNNKWNLSFGCNTCVGSSNNEHFDHRYAKILAEVSRLGPDTVILRGGNVLGDLDRLESMLQYLQTNNLVINTTGHNVNKTSLKKLKGYCTSLTLNYVIFGHDENEFAKYAFKNLSFKNVLECALNIISDKTINYNIILVTGSRLPKEKMSIVSQLREMAAKEPFVCRPQVLDESDSYEPNRFLRLFSNSIHFTYSRRYNWCLNGAIAISANGTVTPCPGIGFSLGNINKQTFHDVLSESKLYSKYWESTKIPGTFCNSCGLKYICCSCLATDILLGDGLGYCDFDNERGRVVLESYGLESIKYS